LFPAGLAGKVPREYHSEGVLMSLPAVIFEERLRIPSEAHRLAPFRHWCAGEEFPEVGRIDFLAGDIEVDMSPEDLHTHGTAKTEVAARLQLLVTDPGRGEVFVDRARVVSSKADLSVEPDIVVVLGESLAAGRVRFVPAAKDPTRSSEIEGAPDLIVEIVSDSSEKKDTARLPRLYAKAGVPELWTIDARGPKIRFSIDRLAGALYRRQDSDADGWTDSPLLDLRCRLSRERTAWGSWRYRFETTGRG
jgi:Uma2 family endonuclease